MQSCEPSPECLTIGSDKVCPDGDRFIVFATLPMDWPIRAYSRVTIYFRSKKYYCRAKYPAERPYAMRYELWPWPDNEPENRAAAIFYDEEYVRGRNSRALGERKNSLIHHLLLPVYPVLGFFWSGVKSSWFLDWGFEPSSLTRTSVGFLFLVCLLQAIFVGWLAGGIVLSLTGNDGLRWVDWVLLVVCLPDCLMRYGGLLRADSAYFLGFYEWLWPFRSDEPGDGSR